MPLGDALLNAAIDGRDFHMAAVCLLAHPESHRLPHGLVRSLGDVALAGAAPSADLCSRMRVAATVLGRRS